MEPLTEEEQAHLRNIWSSEYSNKNTELAELIEDRVENEEREQQDFMDNIKEQFYDEQLQELQGATELSRVINERIYPIYSEGFQAIKE